MTRIDFHSNVPNKIAYACRLVRKAYKAQCHIVLLVKDRTELSTLDQALWTFSEQDFLPHVHVSNPLRTQTPIILATISDSIEYPQHQVLINLSDTTPENFARFERVFEVIPANDVDKAAGRERYRFYKERGYSLSHFVADSH